MNLAPGSESNILFIALVLLAVALTILPFLKVSWMSSKEVP
jgi:hypothetical protein